ncbi:AAA domain-containing protein [Roseovarius lutimaris]|uniref:AAA domain-containing protein n=1 Tax=Roseovarius lutimaris TaxID=1005928 RepID=A0A1I5FZW7_9RHOB|nr:AAA domain-containing protein [Roseovarius lutimaris]SFO29123.1 AAA domain-containing protein [Roseovarius lutimaris]
MAIDVQPHPDWLNLETEVAEPFGWSHLSAPPGQGKSTFCRWLASRTAGNRAILLLDFAQTSENTPGTIFQTVLQRALTEHGIEVAEAERLFEQERIGDQVTMAWVCLEAAAHTLAAQGTRPLVLLDGIDTLLVTSEARLPLLDRLKAHSQGAAPAFDILTTSILSLRSLKERFLVSGLSQAVEHRFRLLDKNDVAFVQDALGGATFKKKVCRKLIKDASGNIAVIRMALDRFSTMGTDQDYDDLKQDLFLDLSDDPEFENTILGEIKRTPHTADQAVHVRDLVQILQELKRDRGKRKAPLPPKKAFLAEDHGWTSTPETSPGRLSAFFYQATDLNALEAKAADLDELARKLEREEAEDAKSSDPTRQRLRKAIHREFCQSEAGVALNATLDRKNERCVVRDRHYIFHLEREKPMEDMAHEVAKEKFMIKVFPNLPKGSGDLLEVELFLLRQLSDQKQPGLPRFDTGGRLDMIDLGEEEVGFILMRVNGTALTDDDILPPQKLAAAFQSEAENAPIMKLIDELLPLAQALDKLHTLGIFHRRLILSNILKDDAVDDATGTRMQKFLLTGFEFAQYIHSFGDVTLPLDEHLAEGMSEVMRARLDRVCSPPEFWSNAETDPAVPNTVPLAMSDVFGLAMVFSLMSHGRPNDNNLARLLDATKPEEQLHEFEALLEQYRQDISENDALPFDLRSILIEGLASDARKRPSSRRFARVLSDLQAALQAQARIDEKKEFLITFHEADTARELQKSHLIPSVSDPNSGDAKDWARDLVTTHFSSATHIVFDADGYSRFVHERHQTGKEKDANIVVLGKSLAAFCTFFRDKPRGREPATFDWALSVRRFVRRSAFGEVLLARNNVRFPNTRVKILGESEEEFKDLKSRRSAGSFKPWTPMVQAANRQSDVINERSKAHASWTFANTVQATIEELSFPVEVISRDHGEVTLDLNATQFSRERENDRYLNLVFRDSGAPSQQAFFSRTIETWLEGDGDTSGQAYFIPEFDETKDKKSGTRIPLTISTLGHGRLIVKSHPRLFGCGKMVFSDAMKLRGERNTKSAVTRDVLLSERLFPQLAAPHPRMIISRVLKDRLKNDLPQGRSAEIVENMLNAEPFFALQGPPGTGKTTALEAYVRLSLELAPLSRLLITSQSHAAVDVVLEKVVKRLEEEENPPVIARVVPVHRPERLSPKAREYDLDDVVFRRANEMSNNAWLSAQSADIDAVGVAWQRIAGLKATAFSEIDQRLRASVSLVFCTTSASRRHLTKVRRDGDPRFSFDVAIVEEAAKASASDLMIPLVQAPRQILIGDHKQLPAFEAQKLISLAKMARKTNEEERLSTGAEDISFSEMSRDLERKMEWFSPFKRMFEQRKALKKDGRWKKENDKVIDTLDIQFRSHEDIGRLVSQTFYDNEIKNGVWDETQHPPPLKLQRIGVADKAITWIDTSDTEKGEFVERDDGNKQLYNLGEAKVIARLIERAGLDMDDRKDNALRERALFLSPYRRQLEAIREQLRDNCAVEIGGRVVNGRETRIRHRLDQIVTSIDASQGSEAELVVVSLVRASEVAGDQPDPRDASPFDWERALRRNFGFLIEPERINVMLSRARTQIVIVGNLDHFQLLDKWVRAWAETHNSYYPAGDPRRDMMDQIRTTHGFWGKMIASIHDVGQIIPAGKVMEQ